RGGVHRRLPALLLGHRGAGRGARRAVPAARHRGRGLPRPAAPVAPRPGRPAGQRESRADLGDPPDLRRYQRSRTGHPVVGGADRGRGRGHGGQARREPDPRAKGARPARPEGARPGVPAADLRPRLHRAGQPDPAAPARPVSQALAGATRVRPRPGGPGPGGRRRAAVARARMRLRRPGAGIRTRRPEALAMTIISVPYHLDEYLPDLDLPLEPNEVVTAALPAGDPWERMAVLQSVVAGTVAGEVASGACPVVMSGDCNTSAGIMAGLQRAGADPAIVWFDAHGDVQTLETTTSGYLGGLALRLLTAYRPELIATRLGLRPVPEDRIVLAGPRDLDPPEATYLAGAA